MTTEYAGNPAIWPSEVPIPNGSDAPSSSLFATSYEGCLDRTAYLYANSLRPGASWRPCFAGGGFFWAASVPGGAFFKPFFDASEGVWVLPIAVLFSAHYTVQAYWSFGQDDGPATLSPPPYDVQPWNPVGSSGSLSPSDSTGIADVACCAGFSTGQVLCAAYSRALQTFTLESTTYTSGTSTTLVSDVLGLSFATLEMAPVPGTNLVVIGIGDNPTAALLFTYTNGGSAIIGVGGVAGPAFANWRFAVGAVSGTPRFVAVPTGTAFPSSGTTNLFWTADGVTWNTVNIFAEVPAGSVVSGLTYSASTQSWFMTVTTFGSGPATMSVYQSQDAVTWVYMNPSHQPAITASDLSCVGGTLVVVAGDATQLGIAGTSQLYFSPDQGQTWYAAGVAFQTNVSQTGGPGTSARLGTSGTQILAINSSQARFSVKGGALGAPV